MRVSSYNGNACGYPVVMGSSPILTPILDHGVMVTLQVLVLSFEVRILVVQLKCHTNEEIYWV